MAAVATNTFAGSNFSAGDTVSGIPIGAAFPGRVVVLAFASNPSTGVTATINGVNADIFENVNGAVFAAAVISTGTTASFFVTGGSGVEVLGAWSLSGYPSTVAQDGFFILDTGAGHNLNIGDLQCAVGFTVSATQAPGPTPSFTTLTNNGAVFNTNVAGPFASVRPARDGSLSRSGAGGIFLIQVTGLSGTWYLGAVSYGGVGFVPPDTSPVGPTWIETRCE